MDVITPIVKWLIFLNLLKENNAVLYMILAIQIVIYLII